MVFDRLGSSGGPERVWRPAAGVDACLTKPGKVVPIAMMVGEMKWALPLLCCLGFCSNPTSAAELTGARTVYLLPMGRGLDQFIANRLTRMHVLQVVTDPAKADAVFTDDVGATLEGRLKDLYPPPPTNEPVPVKEKPETSPV